MEINYLEEEQEFAITYYIDPKKCDLAELCLIRNSLEDKIAFRKKTVEKMKKLDAPQIIIDNHNRLIKDNESVLKIINKYIAEQKLYKAIFGEQKK